MTSSWVRLRSLWASCWLGDRTAATQSACSRKRFLTHHSDGRTGGRITGMESVGLGITGGAGEVRIYLFLPGVRRSAVSGLEWFARRGSASLVAAEVRAVAEVGARMAAEVGEVTR